MSTRRTPIPGSPGHNNGHADDGSGEDVFADDGPVPTSAGGAGVTLVGADLKSMEANAALYRLHVVGTRATHSFLLEEGEHVIGRSSEAGVRVDEDSMSRKHAALRVGASSHSSSPSPSGWPRVTVTDLGSMNGTRVRERTIKAHTPVDVAVGESFELGSVMFVLQRRKQAEKPRRRIYDHGYLETRVDEEIARRAARRTAGSDDSGATLRVEVGGGLTLCRLHVDGLDVSNDPGGPDDVFLQETLEDVLSSTALVAEYAPGELEILFLDEAWDDVEDACDRFVRALDERGAQVRTGFAIFPRDGRTASSLLSVANSKVQSTVTAERQGYVPSSSNAQSSHSSSSHSSSSSQQSSRPAPARETPREVVRESGAMERLQKLVERVAPSDISIVIHGETGVGKEVMARQIHNLSHRAGKPFVGLNCAALTETLLESELFGHERGAFSGAVNTKPGLFEVAEKGTVFLDEIGEMSPAIQAKLLRVLEERTVLRVGGLSPRAIDVRFLAASHKDLENEAADGHFRQDLYFRLNGITLEIPPLRDRISELEGLITNFVADVCRRGKKTEIPVVDKQAMALLKGYSWPGNIRELRNIIERAVILCGGPRITPEHLPVERLQKKHAPNSSSHSSHASHSSQGSGGQQLRAPPMADPLRPGRAMLAPGFQRPPPRIDADDEDSGTSTRPALRRPAGADGGRGVPADDDMTLPPMRGAPGYPARPPMDSLKDAVSDLERERIIDALKQCGGNQTKAAEMLGISRRTLLNRLDQYNLPRPRK